MLVQESVVLSTDLPITVVNKNIVQVINVSDLYFQFIVFFYSVGQCLIDRAFSLNYLQLVNFKNFYVSTVDVR